MRQTEIFIRKATKADTTRAGKLRAFRSIPDKLGYSTVYKPYGTPIKSFFYVAEGVK